MAKTKGKIVIISSPSGGGKTTICNRLRARNPEWLFSISYTTRDKRKNETDGIEYFFTTIEEFKQLKADDYFAESAKVHLYYYGTPRKPLEGALKKGKTILLDVDVKGAVSIKKNYPEAISLFILPPSTAELTRRLERRGTETKEQVKVRLDNALAETKKYNRFDYIIVNKDINDAVNAADHMIKSWTVGVTYFGRNKSKAYPVPK
ncbi:MAG: guanylate kinase [candidate division Zixibacteria bacterium]|nr:guanylate kinase [candidate division Zixibacteria bacterium]